MNLIEQAVAPLRQASIDAAMSRAHRIVEAFIKSLAENDNDLKIVAPYPKSSDRDFRAKEQYYYFARSITKSRGSVSLPSAPCQADLSPEGVSRYFDEVQEDAANAFNAYVAKLNDKVGQVDEAKMIYDRGIWNESILEVKKAEGVERWKTQIIVNFSKYNKPFNQFPTRKLK